MLILPPDIIDKLDSTSKEDGLSANQGRLIDLRVQNLETSSAKFKGNFATPTDLQTAFPSPQVGDYAYVISTSSQWVESSGVWLDTEKDLKDNFLNKNNNLSELTNTTTARTNLSVYSTTEVDTALSNNATADRNRTNHTGTQTASTISDFQSTVSSNTDVSANTSARHTHSNKTILDNITASYTTAEQTKLAGIQDGAEVNIQANWTETNNTLDSYIQNKPTLATVATSGDHADLSNKGTNTHAQIDSALSSLSSNKADKVTGAVAGNIAQLDASGNLVDSGIPKTELHQNRAIWGYQDFIAGSITSVNVTLTTNQNGTSAPFNILNITGTGFIVRSDDLEEYAYTGTSKLFSSKVKINSITNDAVVLSGVPHSSYPIRIYYQIIASYFPSNYKMPPAILSASALDKLDPIIATQTELDTGLSSKEPTITNLPYTKGGTGLNTLTGQALKTIRVKSTEDGYEFITNTSSAVWGAITGTLSSQTDLQNALNSKLDKIVGTNTNYLSKWDASNNLVKASLFEDVSGNVGIGTTSPSSKLHVVGASTLVGTVNVNSSNNIQFNGGAGKLYFGDSSSNYYPYITSPVADVISFNSNSGAERLRIDTAGNVGIGTNNPAYRLSLNNSASSGTGITLSANGLPVQISRGGLFNYYYENSNYVFDMYNYENGGYIRFGTEATERMRIDSSGNLGLGVTPSAWSQGKAFEVNENGYGVWNGTKSSYLIANAYFNSGFKYAYTGHAASHYYQFQGAHVWSTAPSGTAGDSITFTPAMTLNTANKLLLGTTSPGAFDMVKFAGADTVANDLTLYGPASSQVRITFSRPGADGRGEIGYNMSTDILRFVVAGQQRITIDSAGDLFIVKFAGGGDTSLRIDNNGRIYRGA